MPFSLVRPRHGGRMPLPGAPGAEVLDESRLANAWFAGHQDEAHTPLLHCSQAFLQPLRLRVATDERRPAHGVRTADTPGGIVVALDTRLDDALIHEGWARDVIRHVQTLRKDADLDVTDRIRLWLEIDDTALRAAVQTHLDTIAAEVLANATELDAGPAEAPRREFTIAGTQGAASLTRA